MLLYNRDIIKNNKQRSYLKVLILKTFYKFVTYNLMVFLQFSKYFTRYQMYKKITSTFF